MTALEMQRRRLMLEREKMRSRSKTTKLATDTISKSNDPKVQHDTNNDRRSLSRESISPPSPLDPRCSSSSSTDVRGVVVNTSSLPTFRPDMCTSDRKARGSIDKPKVSAWNKVKSIDVKRELAENVVVRVMDNDPDDHQTGTSSSYSSSAAIDAPFSISIQLRDTSWRITRSISDYILLCPLVPGLAPLDTVTSDMSRTAVRAAFQHALHVASRLCDAWAIDAFAAFFDNHFSMLALLLHAKHLSDRVVALESAHEATKGHLKACQDTVGAQQVLLNSLAPSTPPSLRSAPPPSSSGSLWESASSPWSSASSSCVPSTSCRHLATQTPMWVPSNSLPTAADVRAHRVLAQLAPSPAAVTHRQRIFHSIASIIKTSLRVLAPHAQVMLISGSAAHIFLPDSPLRVGVFFPTHSSGDTLLQWHMKVNEALCHASNAVCNAAVSNDSKNALLIQHVELSNAATDGTGPHVTCNVGHVTVDMCANPLRDLRGAHFMASIDALIGRDHLFKRSVLLVYGWLRYECPSSSSSSSPSSPSSSSSPSPSSARPSIGAAAPVSLYAIATLVLYVFNLYHDSIHLPLQAAAHFFGLFAAFPWDGFCVAIEGPRDLRSVTSPPQRPRDGAAPLWMPPHLLRRHRSGRLDDPPPPSTGSEESRLSVDDDDEEEVARMLHFPIKHINIMDPIDASVNLGHALSAKQATQFRQALDLGATKLHGVVSAMKKEMTSAVSTSLGSTSSVSLLDGCFRHIAQRFQTGYRPDTAVVPPLDVPDEGALSGDLLQSLSVLTAPTPSHPPPSSVGTAPPGLSRPTPLSTSSVAPPCPTSGDALAVCLESLRHDVLVCDFVVTGRVTAPAVYSMAMEVLEDRGALPIGEIGKCLQETATAATALSAVLKDQFGGLKKFLEQYPAVFLVSSDHPFNPKVYLHRMLTESSAAQVLDGTLVEACRKKKPKPTRRSKKADRDDDGDAPRSISLALLPSQHGVAGPPPPPGIGFPLPLPPRSLSFESSLKKSAAAFVPNLNLASSYTENAYR
ncbi:hypothetical protein DYB30_000827 [Aphanomyces astaci]|uniref:PAP/OAS1 substrate-binding-related domain-containing protein n=1 Tax=Aphanomyces astaci TaxID=112090 RepID=A0A397DYV8_APHAT|nr:hypothetical protein DYB30_000827 [Aphanomyces astaci]